MRDADSGAGVRRPAPRRRREPAAAPATPLVLAPKPSGVFAQPALGRADAPITRSRKVADQHRRRAEAALPGTTVPGVQRIPDVPLNHVQRQAVLKTARQVAVRARRQGIDVTDAATNGDPVTRDFFAKAAKAAADEQKHVAVKTGLARLRSDPNAFGIKPRQLEALHKLAVRDAIPEEVRTQLAAIGHRAGDTVRPGRADRKVGWGPATVNVTAASRAILGATSLGGASDENAFLKHAVGDVAALGQAPFVGGYEVGRSAWDAAHGDTTRGKRLASGVWEGVKTSVPGELLQGHPGAALESFRQHPVFGALDVAGGVGLIGRGAGALARGAGSTVEGAGIRGALARTGSTVRPAIGLNVEGSLAHVQRTYSKDLTRKAAQVAADKARQPLRDPRGRVVTVRDRGRRVPVLKAHAGEHELLHARRMDFTASRANATERLSREVTAHDVDKAGAPGGTVRGRGQRLGKRGERVVSMVTEGTIRPGEHFRPDLAKRLARLDERLKDPKAAGYRHSGEVKKARQEADAIRAVLGSPKALAQAERVVAAGQHVGRLRRAQDAEEIRLGTLDPSAAERARLEPYAIAHMDARHVTVEEHQALERAALQMERAARAKVDALPKGPARAQALAEWRQARHARIETSGRHTSGVHAHEGAKAAHAAATRKVTLAQQKVAKLERSRQRLIGKQQIDRGGPVQAVEATKDAGRDVAYRSGLGAKHIMEAPDLSHVRSFTIPPGRSHGTTGTHRLSDAQVAAIDRRLTGEGLKRTTNADGSTTWRRAAANGNPASGKATQRAKVSAKVEAQLKTARAELSAARAAARDAEKAAVAARLPEINAALRGPDGRFLSNEAIVADMRKHGVDPDTVAQLSHRALGNSAFHKRFDVSSRPAPGGQRRTGHAYERGASGFGPGQVEETAVNAATRITKAQQVDRFIADNALRHPALGKAQRGDALSKAEQRVAEKGGGFTAAEAAEVADRLKNDTGREYVAVRMHGAKVSADTQQAIRDGLQGSAPMVPLGDRLLNDRIVDLSTAVNDPAAGKMRNIALVPLEDVNRLQRHLAPAGEIERVLQMLNRPFRFSVLAQPRWLTGNFVEPFLVRLPMVGSGLVNIPGLAIDIAASKRVLRDMKRSGDPRVRAAAQEIQAQQLGGLFLGNRGASNRRRAADSSSRVVRVGAALRDLPVVKQLGDALAWLPNTYFRANRQLIEQWAQHAGLGHQIRQDVQAISGSWTKAIVLGKKARAEAIRGLVNTPTQERFMRAQHELLGKYEGFSPATRRLVQTIAPFLPWAMSASRFVWWTMPAHHTIKTALLIKSSQVFAEEWAADHQPGDVPPGELRIEPRRADGGFTPLARYTPYSLSGAMVNGDTAGIVDQFMPQLSGAEQAMHGKDPFGKPLQVKPTPGNPKGIPTAWQKVLIALNSGIESTAGPYPSMVRRLREGGGTPYADSTALSPKTKPGSKHMSGARRTFDPFRPTYVGAPTPTPTGSGKGAPAGGAGGLDPADLHDLRQAVQDSGAKLDSSDLEEIRSLVRGG